MTKPKIGKRQRPRRTIDEERRRRRRRRTEFSLPALVLLAAASTTISLFASAQAEECNPCIEKSSGFVQIPDTECAEFGQCDNGRVSQRFNCQGGLIYDSNISGCNWAASATCGPDPVCPTPEPTRGPSGEPTDGPTTYAPTRGSGGGGEGPEEGESSLDSRPDAGDTTTSPPPPSPTPPLVVPPSAPSAPAIPPPMPPPTQTIAPPIPILSGLGKPVRLEHHSAVWAHLNANKITISNQLLRMAHRLQNVAGNNINAEELRNYAYYDFYGALQSMAEEGYAVPMGANQLDGNGNPLLARSVFYLGDARRDDAAAAGLINAAAFLSQAMADSVSSGSCDEWSEDVVDGLLPESNACGQYGLSYQDMICPQEEDRGMECAPYGGMERYAAPNGRPVTPFYCGGREVFPVTGSAEQIAGRAPMTEAAANQNGRTEVEGCCWWGRGTIRTRGICQYGKLNYYLGARAAEEGRPARYPAIDFCNDPSSICSAYPKQDSKIEWISGLFRWIDDVQSYDDVADGWNYVQKLQEFVSGGMVDGLFINSVSAIVTQGCHRAPCPGVAGTGVEMDDAGERWSYFLQVLEALGLPTEALRQS